MLALRGRLSLVRALAGVARRVGLAFRPARSGGLLALAGIARLIGLVFHPAQGGGEHVAFAHGQGIGRGGTRRRGICGLVALVACRGLVGFLPGTWALAQQVACLGYNLGSDVLALLGMAGEVALLGKLLD